MKFITLEEFSKTQEYKNFIQENSAIGQLKIMAFTAYQAIPISNAEIVITKDIGDYKVTFFRGKTDSSGIIDNIDLPAPPSGYNIANFKINNYTIYNLAALHSGYDTIKNYTVAMFGDLKVIQHVKMVPKVDLERRQNGNY